MTAEMDGALAQFAKTLDAIKEKAEQLTAASNKTQQDLDTLVREIATAQTLGAQLDRIRSEIKLRESELAKIEEDLARKNAELGSVASEVRTVHGRIERALQIQI